MAREHYQVLVIGGGAGGLAVASRLARESDVKSVAIIEPSDKHFYQPMWTLVGGGVVQRETTVKPMAELIPKGVTWIHDAVAQFAPEQNFVCTRDGKEFGYDFLVVAAGIQIDWGKIKGLPEALGKGGVCSNYSYDTAPYTWETIRNLKQGTALFTFPATPIKCAGAPQKIMYLTEDHLRKNGLRDKVDVVYMCANPTIFSAPKYAQILLEKIAKPRGIEVNFRHNLTEIRPEAKEAVFTNLDTNETVVRQYDMLHVAPPMSAPDFIKQSPLANDAGWVDVHKETLRHNRFANVFALGDNSSLPTSKTAAAVRAQMPVLCENLLAALRQKEGMGRYDGYTSCPLVTGYGKLILAEFDYELKPKETFPFDQGKERLSMYWLKRYVLPLIYWFGLIRGSKWFHFG